MFDVAIIGAGPAGLSAAITAVQRNLSVCVFYTDKNSIEKASEINNYPGFSNISGEELNDIFYKQAENSGCTLVKALVRTINKVSKNFMILAGNDVYEAKTIIISTGILNDKLLENEDTYLGKGVSYCATCDGMLYRNKTVCVIAYSNSAKEEAHFLSSVADKVYYIATSEKYVLDSKKNMQIILSKPNKIISSGNGLRVTGKDLDIEADGVFIFRDSIAPTGIIENLEINKNHIKVDNNYMTNIDGVFAAGDCIGRPYQIAKAVGEGNISAINAAEYIIKEELK